MGLKNNLSWFTIAGRYILYSPILFGLWLQDKFRKK